MITQSLLDTCKYLNGIATWERKKYLKTKDLFLYPEVKAYTAAE